MAAIEDNPDEQLERLVNNVLVNYKETAAGLIADGDSFDEDLPVVQASCQVLYRRVQDLSRLFAQHTSNKEVSSLPELVLMDAETIWGQVELQNEAIKTLLQRSCKHLSKEDSIQLLQVLDSDEESNNEEDASDGEDDDDQARMEARMRRAMGDMDDDDESEDSDNASERETNSSVNTDEFERDENALNMHDGFFNLQEMEAFADEEEEYLPAEAFGEVKSEDKKSDRSFHQKQRDRDMELEQPDDEDEDNVDSSTLRRKKYRSDREVDALLSLYEEGNDVESDDAVIQMTAADLFGKPNDKYLNRWRSRRGETKDKESWSEFDAGLDSKGWNNEEDNSEEVESDPENDEESVVMKPATQASKPPTKQAAIVLRQTEQLEKELLAEKPWQMKGETGSSSRPINSLLESTPEFEVAAKVAPAITVEFTENLEEMIQRRILAEDWDDVVPRELPDVGWNAKRGEVPEVSQEKSKLSLGELYEREYLKKAVGYDVDAAEKETEEEKAKNEMRTLFANLCSKLDALSNYHFAPRPVADEADIRQVAKPAIAMEEVLPLHVSDATAVAPEEVFAAKRGRAGVLRDDSELEQPDRKRLRNAKKSARRKARQAKLADEKLISRLQPGNGLSNPYEKRKMREDLAMARAGGKVTAGTVDTNDYGDSTTFFKRIQQEAKSSIAGAKGDSEADRKEKRPKGKSSQLIL